MSLTHDIKAQAAALGFDLVGVTPLQAPPHAAAFGDWLAAGYQGEMAYLPARAALRMDPAAFVPGARSAIVLSVRYDPGPPPAGWEDPSRGRIARYAWAPDYHDQIKPRLFALDAYLRARTGRQEPGKACVDTAPLLERDFAMLAGLGFVGKNTCLIAPRQGSWCFLAALLVPEELDYDPPAQPLPSPPSGARDFPVWLLAEGQGTCGACTRCLVACPTQAFTGPYTLDARRCISYLTIELRGPIPRALRPQMGNWIFGCDICQEVCPYNRDRDDPEAAGPEIDRVAPPLLDLLALDEVGFRARFRGTPLVRAKRRGLVRNACVAAGNWGDPAAVPQLAALVHDAEALVRGHAAWALGRIGDPAARQALAKALSLESDPWAQEELHLALESDGPSTGSEPASAGC